MDLVDLLLEHQMLFSGTEKRLVQPLKYPNVSVRPCGRIGGVGYQYCRPGVVERQTVQTKTLCPILEFAPEGGGRKCEWWWDALVSQRGSPSDPRLLERSRTRKLQ